MLLAFRLGVPLRFAWVGLEFGSRSKTRGPNAIKDRALRVHIPDAKRCSGVDSWQHGMKKMEARRSRLKDRAALARGQGAFGFPEDQARGGPGSTVAFGAPCGEAIARCARARTGEAPHLTH